MIHDVRWTIGEGERWVISGRNGVGKSTLAAVLAGREFPSPRAGRVYPTEAAGLLAARRRTAVLTLETLEFFHRSSDRTCGTDARIGTHPALGDGAIAADAQTQAALIADFTLFGVADAAHRALGKLSQGERTLVLLALLLATNPFLIVLDEVLDHVSRRKRSIVLARLTELDAAAVICVSQRPERYIAFGYRSATVADGRLKISEADTTNVLQEPQCRTVTDRAESLDVGAQYSDNVPIFELLHADVVIGGRTVLADLTWQIRSGEHWRICGQNGAGKSVLCTVIAGKRLIASTGICRRYGASGPFRVDDLEITLLSDDIARRFDGTMSVTECLESGVVGSIGLYDNARDASLYSAVRASEVIESFALESFLARSIGSLSAGERRRVLIARAFIRPARIFIADELTMRLDAPTRECFLDRLYRSARSGTSIVYVTHDEEDVPAYLTHRLELRDGRILSSGPMIVHP